MAHMAKKVILFVVEGPSDETAFALPFTRVFDRHLVTFDVTHCDITTKYANKRADRYGSELNVKERVRDQIIEHIKGKPYEWDDMQRIVHIVDTDGAFISDEKVVPSLDARLLYFEDHVEASDKEGICKRNYRKRHALAQLCCVSELKVRSKAVPYAVYYLSRNMEHVLHGRGDDVSDEEKKRLSHEFRRRFQNDPEGFRSFLSTSAFAVKGDYAESWRYVREGIHSLERCSNLHLVLPPTE